MTETIAEKAARIRAQREAAKPKEPDYSQYAELVPEPEPIHKSPEATELDRVIEGVDILDAYNRWCGKSEPRKISKSEFMVSCPRPDHPDANPSACVNVDKQVWFCNACQEGGDKFDIAAYHFGMPVPGYKSKDQFPELRRRIGADLGFVTVKSATGATVTLPPQEPPPAASAPQPVPPAEPEEPAGQVIAVQFRPDEEDFASATEKLAIDWQSFLPEGTYWRTYMEATERFTQPTEFYLFTCAQSISTALGDALVMIENPNILANLNVCLVGPTGSGKSTAIGMIETVIRGALPYDFDDPKSSGTYCADEPNSGEALLDTFSSPEMDPTAPKKVLAYHPVRALVKAEEFSSFLIKANRSGSTLKTALIRLFDGRSLTQRSRGAGVTVVERPFCQMVAGTQPRLLRKQFASDDADSGFLNRWIFVMGPAKRLRAHNTEVFDPAPLLPLLTNIRNWTNLRHREYHLQGDALAKWEKFFRREIEPIRQAVDDLPMLTRADLTLKKLMIDLGANEMALDIEPRHVEIATDVFWPYLQDTYGLISGQIGIGEVDACAEAIVECIRKHEARHNKPPTARDIHGRYLKRKYNQGIILKAINNMKALGLVRELEPPKDSVGQPAFRYSLPAN